MSDKINSGPATDLDTFWRILDATDPPDDFYPDAKMRELAAILLHDIPLEEVAACRRKWALIQASESKTRDEVYIGLYLVGQALVIAHYLVKWTIKCMNTADFWGQFGEVTVAIWRLEPVPKDVNNLVSVGCWGFFYFSIFIAASLKWLFQFRCEYFFI
ncbi:hypothetical protein ABW21_db0200082 [Orbilia brochopaga]|nr:hypothetical protein ABW21_db0200082 [Drechslerella brochopaga]